MPHRLLIAGYLLSYGDRTRAAYLADLRDFHAWCARNGIGLLASQRGHIEAYSRSRATVARRLATLAGFYRYAVRRERSPTPPPPTFVAPRWARDSQTLGLEREKAVRFLAAA